MKNFGLILCIGISILPVWSQAQKEHTPFQELLSSHVTATSVDYVKLKNVAHKLDAYLRTLTDIVPTYEDRSAKAKAFWINAYNAFTLKLIIDHYPIKSIRDLHHGNPWDVAWIQLGSNKYTLNQIEKDILIKGFGDPRVHFAINCAAKSCPPLSKIAFTSLNVEAQLEELTRNFINNDSFNQLSESQAAVSRIFEWYAEDFGQVSDYLRKYGSVASIGPITYTNYDWSLNDRSKQGL